MKAKINELKSYGKNFKVLYVEDNNEAREQTNKMLSNFFPDITLGVDGVDGLEKYLSFYKKHDYFYDLVITDINMPNMDGLEMSEEILKKNSLQSIIIVSAHNEAEFLTKAIDVGVSGFLTKPVNNIQLINVLFKTSLAISDRKFVEEHVQQMEEMTLKLEEQYNEVITKNAKLEKSLRILDTMVHKEQISHPVPKSEKENDEEKYVREQLMYLINEDLHELIELHSEIDIIIIETLNDFSFFDEESKHQLVVKFTKYASTLNQYSFFTNLSKEITIFANTLQNEPFPEDNETVKNIFILLESFIYVIGKWQDDLKSGDINRVNALDASITSDMKTITNMWSQEEGEIQNIFDF